MKHLATYCLLVLDGKASVSLKVVEDFMKASGVTSDPASLYIMMTRLEGKTLPWLIKEVSGKLAAMPAGGAVPEEKKEAEPEEDIEMGDFCTGVKKATESSL